ncbi:hypothetical protein QYF36_008319 [Acer negundo]|nr:hypothetical protein QYF36_008319 [Acer negundo]
MDAVMPEAADKTVRMTKEAKRPLFIQEVGHTSSFREECRRRGGLTANSGLSTTSGFWFADIGMGGTVVGMARAIGK